MKKGDLEKIRHSARAFVQVTDAAGAALSGLGEGPCAILACTFAILGDPCGIARGSRAILKRSFEGATRRGDRATGACVLPTNSFDPPTSSCAPPTSWCGVATRPSGCATTRFASATGRDGRAKRSSVIAGRLRGSAQSCSGRPTRWFASAAYSCVSGKGGGQPPRMGRGLDGSARGPPLGPRGRRSLAGRPSRPRSIAELKPVE